MFGWLFKAAKKEAKGWNHTNFLMPDKRTRGRNDRRHKALSALRQCQAEKAQLKAKIKQLNNQIMQLKKINKAQAPMPNSGVNVGTYQLYQQGFKRILQITYKRQRLSTYTMPEIRAVCDEMLGMSKPSEFHGWNRNNRPVGANGRAMKF